MFQSEFTKALISEFWESNFDKIFMKCFVPHVIYMIITHLYLMHVLDKDFYMEESEENGITFWIRFPLGILAIYTWAY